MESLFGLLALLSVLLLVANTVDARPAPNDHVQIVRDDTRNKLDVSKPDCHKTFEPKEEKSFLENFEPRPNISAYGANSETNEGKGFVKDFEPRPNISAYGDDSSSAEKAFVNDFEPRPNVSAYGDDSTTRGDKAFVKDFEPRPNISIYHD